jgi:hypothetical protein
MRRLSMTYGLFPRRNKPKGIKCTKRRASEGSSSLSHNATIINEIKATSMALKWEIPHVIADEASGYLADDTRTFGFIDFKRRSL